MLKGNKNGYMLVKILFYVGRVLFVNINGFWKVRKLDKKLERVWILECGKFGLIVDWMDYYL